MAARRWRRNGPDGPVALACSDSPTGRRASPNGLAVGPRARATQGDVELPGAEDGPEGRQRPEIARVRNELVQPQGRRLERSRDAGQRLDDEAQAARVRLRARHLDEEPGDRLLVAHAPGARLVLALLVVDQVGDLG